MIRLYNISPYPLTVDRGGPAVFPGEGYDFPDDGPLASGWWSEKDPREGIEQERAFRARRKRETARLADTDD
jgi:hypothetical protein